MEMTEAAPPPDPARIALLEKTFEVQFPADYLKFLSSANGAVPRQKMFDGPGGERVIERFLPILDDPESNAARGWTDIAVVASQLDSRLVPDEDATGMALVPIATLFAGDFLVLDYRADPAKPSIAVWDHELSDDFAPVARTVSPSFSAFLESLKE